VIRVCHVEDVPLGEGRVVAVADERIALFRARSGWYALANRCPHAGGPLADGLLCDTTVTCPLHERRFDLRSGRCLNDSLDVAAFAVEVRGDAVFVAVGRAQEPARSQAATPLAAALGGVGENDPGAVATPRAAIPQAETPQAETPQAETPQAETPQAETPQAETLSSA
jgi:nitrite reductase (NADH) small subunit